MPDGVDAALALIWSALGGAEDWPRRLRVTGRGGLPSAFAVTDLAAASVAAAGLAVAELTAARHGGVIEAAVDRRLASMWFAASIRPEGWAMPGLRSAVTGDYRTSDGWIRLHANAPHHLRAALAALGAPEGRDQVARAVRQWEAEALETAVLERGGCAAAMRGMAAWAAHPQGRAVAAEPLVAVEPGSEPGSPGPAPGWPIPRDRPLRGIRVLDMTRVLAGPVATRFLAGFGAEVLRIDPPGWDEPGVVPDVALGKRCARLDLRQPDGRAAWERLLRGADVLVHGYRPGALAGLGLDDGRRQALRPGLVDVSLDAYGWSGPWRGRRGFDSLVQMSGGIAEAGMARLGRDRPTPLPVQALDHATGYIIAAAVARGLTRRLSAGAGTVARASLARTAALLTGLPAEDEAPLAPETPADSAEWLERTSWGLARRLRPPCALAGAPMRWDHPATALGSASACWAA